MMAIRRSGLFDAVWYLERLPGDQREIDPVEHYVARGARAGYAPHPLFLTAWYERQHPESTQAGSTPLGHYIRCGEAMGATPHPLFDPVWYAETASRSLSEGLFRHFLQHGAGAGLSPHPCFDVDYYDAQRPEIAVNGLNRLTHFVQAGVNELVAPNQFFDPAYYLRTAGSDFGIWRDYLSHFLMQGCKIGLRPHPDVALELYLAEADGVPSEPKAAYTHLVKHQDPRQFFHADNAWIRNDPHRKIAATQLFDAQIYAGDGAEPNTAWADFLRHGLSEGRVFTHARTVARRLASLADTLSAAGERAEAQATAEMDGAAARAIGRDLAACGVAVGVYCNSEGSFFLHEIADALAYGLTAAGVMVVRRDERSAMDEPLGLRIFVAPHEFFYLGSGPAWDVMADAQGSVVYNVEQMQTPWFCRAFKYIVRAKLALDINFQTSCVLQQAGFNVVHFMPGHLPASPHTQPIPDLSTVALARGYPGTHIPHDWTLEDRLSDRSIDVLFIANASPRRDRMLPELMRLTDHWRCMTIYTANPSPVRLADATSTSTSINTALAQRAKIVLNIHRDWLGYFEWSRMVLQGFWQGACVVSDRCLPDPIFRAGREYLEEDTRHLGEFVQWLLSSGDGQQLIDATRQAGLTRARAQGSMLAAIRPALTALRDLAAG